MEKRKNPPANQRHRGLMEDLLRRRDPGGELPFDEEEEDQIEEDIGCFFKIRTVQNGGVSCII